MTGAAIFPAKWLVIHPTQSAARAAVSSLDLSEKHFAAAPDKHRFSPFSEEGQSVAELDNLFFGVFAITIRLDRKPGKPRFTLGRYTQRPANLGSLPVKQFSRPAPDKPRFSNFAVTIRIDLANRENSRRRKARAHFGLG